MELPPSAPPATGQSGDDGLFKISRDGHVATLTLSRPDLLNTIANLGDGDRFTTAFQSVNDDPEVRCAILTGAGRAFSAGGNLKAMHHATDQFEGGGTQLLNQYLTNVRSVVRAVRNLDVPLIAAVNGPAMGLGCDVACLADIRIAADTARFGAPFVKLGLVPGDGGAWLLQRVIGHSRAAEMLFTGDIIESDTALEWGLVSRVVPLERLMDEARALAARIAERPPQALRMTKRMMRAAQTSDLDAALDLAASTQSLLHLSEDHREGVAAALEKRPPHFTGR